METLVDVENKTSVTSSDMVQHISCNTLCQLGVLASTVRRWKKLPSHFHKIRSLAGGNLERFSYHPLPHT